MTSKNRIYKLHKSKIYSKITKSIEMMTRDEEFCNPDPLQIFYNSFQVQP